MRRWLREKVWYPIERRLLGAARALGARRRGAGATRAQVEELFPEERKCVHCGGWHPHACPRLRSVVFRPSGEIVRVEFWPWGEWPQNDVVWPWQKVRMITLPDEEEGATPSL